MRQDFADWYADNTDADYETVVLKVEEYLESKYYEGYDKGYDEGYSQGSENQYKMQRGF